MSDDIELKFWMETLKKRLAGPSTGKAGIVSDQTHINEVIFKASEVFPITTRFTLITPGK